MDAFIEEHGVEPKPGIFELLEMMDNADEAWKEKAKERLAVYETMLSVWMNDYAGTAMGREKDVLYSELKCTIPAEAVKAEIKTLRNTMQDKSYICSKPC